MSSRDTSPLKLMSINLESYCILGAVLHLSHTASAKIQPELPNFRRRHSPEMKKGKFRYDMFEVAGGSSVTK